MTYDVSLVRLRLSARHAKGTNQDSIPRDGSRPGRSSYTDTVNGTVRDLEGD